VSGFAERLEAMRDVTGVGRRSSLGEACGRETEEVRDNGGIGGGAELAKVVDVLRRGSGALVGTKAQPNRDARVAFWEDFCVGTASGCSSSTIDEVSELDEIYNKTAEQRALTCDCVCIKVSISRRV